MIPFKFFKNAENFFVEEVPAYRFSGKGEHIILKIKKRNITTIDVIKRISKLTKVKEKFIGYAGLKDKYSTSVQYISVPINMLKIKPENLSLIADENIELLDITAHKNKIRAGHLMGNIFTVKLKEVKNIQALKAAIKNIEQTGFPNFFDEQRFGDKGQNVELGIKLLKGEKRLRSAYTARLMVSAVSAYIFNEYLKERINRNLYNTILDGDLLINGVPTGPIIGFKTPKPKNEALKLEREILSRVKIEETWFSRFKSKGSRRPIKAFPNIIETKDENPDFTIKFFLPKGAFATLFIKELENTLKKNN